MFVKPTNAFIRQIHIFSTIINEHFEVTQLVKNFMTNALLLQMWSDKSQLTFTEVSDCRRSVIHIKFATGEEENFVQT